MAKRKTIRKEKIPRSLGPQAVAPDSVRVQLRYNTRGGLNTTATGFAAQVFNLSSLYDPDYSASGHQPTGFDQWMLIYNRYRVYNVRVHVKFACHPSEQTQTFETTMVPQTSTTTTYSTIAEYIEDPRAQFGVLRPGVNSEIMGSYDLQEMFGTSKAQFADIVYSGTETTSPSTSYYLHIAVESMIGAASAQSVLWCARLDYDCEFYERKNLSISLNRHHSTCRCLECYPDLPIKK